MNNGLDTMLRRSNIEALLAPAGGPTTGCSDMADLLDRNRLAEALRQLGEDLASRGTFIELAVYGGSAIMMQFDWRRSTSDVDAGVRDGYDEALLAQSVPVVSQTLKLDPNWLNNASACSHP